MNNERYRSFTIICVCFLLVGIGIVMVYSASFVCAAERFSDEAYFLKRQMAYAIIGIFFMIVLRYIPYQFLRKIAYPLWFLGLILLLLIMIPQLSVKAGGASRWLRFGPLRFQPSEIAKLCLILVLASCFSKKTTKQIKRFTVGFLPPLLFTVPYFMLILLQPDFGTAMLLIAILFLFYFIVGVRKTYLLTSGLIMLIGACLLIICARYRFERIVFSFLHPWQNATSSGYQVVQSFLALGKGGVSGVGWGNGTQKLYYLPESHTDFILSVIGEELGFIGITLIILLFIILIYCGLTITIKAKDPFSTYLAFGLTLLLAMEAIINMGVVSGVVPPKGSTLPFISYGGTSLVRNLVDMGILLNISLQVR